MKTALRISASLFLVASARGQLLLSDDFSAATIDPSKWTVVTTGMPFGTPSVHVENGACVLQNRGHLVSTAHFDSSVIGPYRVRCQWTWLDDMDRFQILLRSDGIPSGPWGETANGLELIAGIEGGSSVGIGSRGNLIQLGAALPLSGPGVSFTTGVTYTAEFWDVGGYAKLRVEGPGGQWWEAERQILSDATTEKHIVFHNREQTMGFHQCLLDNVDVDEVTSASYTAFGSGCSGPTGLVPSLTPVGASVPRIGSTSSLRVSGLPLAVCIPLFAYGLSNSVANGPFGPLALPLDLSVLGWPGCYQLVSTEILELEITNTGSAEHPLVLPYAPSWVGLNFYVQSIVFYNPTGTAVTNGVHGVVGY